MRAEVEGPDAGDASGISKARAIASLVACLTALNAPVEPAIELQPVPVAPVRRRRGFAMPFRGIGLAAPALAVLLIFIATASLADRKANWPAQLAAAAAHMIDADPDGRTDWCGRPCANR